MTLLDRITGASSPPYAAASLPDGERIYAVGDVHGRLDLLESLIAAIRADNERRSPARVTLLLLGDIIDLGDDSAELVSYCMEYTKSTRRFIVLKGNHEAMMVEAYRGNAQAMRVWQGVGGDASLYSWGVAPDVIDRGDPAELLDAMRRHVAKPVIDWLAHLPLTHQAGTYFFVHAGVRPGVALARQKASDMLWIKDDFTLNRSRHPMMIVHGHTEYENGPEILGNRIGVDTAAYRTDILSAVCLDGATASVLRTPVERSAQKEA